VSSRCLCTHRRTSYLASRVKERLKDLLRQYELRERHFDAIIRSKELEVMLSKARTQEIKAQLEREVEALAAAQYEVCWSFALFLRAITIRDWAES
jgi:hypothetical protein